MLSLVVVDPLMIEGHKISSKETASYLVSSPLPWLDLIAAYMRLARRRMVKNGLRGAIARIRLPLPSLCLLVVDADRSSNLPLFHGYIWRTSMMAGMRTRVSKQPMSR
ncbi:unnamed protein product [Urochloa humidicola]